MQTEAGYYCSGIFQACEPTANLGEHFKASSRHSSKRLKLTSRKEVKALMHKECNNDWHHAGRLSMLAFTNAHSTERKQRRHKRLAYLACSNTRLPVKLHFSLATFRSALFAHQRPCQRTCCTASVLMGRTSESARPLGHPADSSKSASPTNLLKAASKCCSAKPDGELALSRQGCNKENKTPRFQTLVWVVTLASLLGCCY